MTGARWGDRPTAAAVLDHPLFWAPGKRLGFLVELSDRLELEPPGASPLLAAVETDAGTVVGAAGWHARLDPGLLGDAVKFRRCAVRGYPQNRHALLLVFG
jgi:serine/threonine-protein kinase/endoribonuclease IRE1